MASGLYIVTLENIEPVAVNAHDARRADFCIRVNRDNCKVGKARDLAARRRNYWRTFGREQVCFRPFALLEEIERAEKIVLDVLSAWRVRGSTGRRNEWLAGISASGAERKALDALDAARIAYRPWTGGHPTGLDTPLP